MNMKKLTGIVIGAVLIACGILGILNIFEIAVINFSLDGWWTMFIILPCLHGLVNDRNKTGSIIGLCIGVLLLLAARDVLDYSMVWKLIITLIVVVIGINLIVKSVISSKDTSDTSDGDNTETCDKKFNREAVYSGNTEFTDARVGALFGGATCNLKNAKIKDASIEVFCIFGGVDIIVPEGVTVKNNTFTLFGGTDDKRTSNGSDGSSLTITGYCLFGGIEINDKKEND